MKLEFYVAITVATLFESGYRSAISPKPLPGLFKLRTCASPMKTSTAPLRSTKTSLPVSPSLVII